MGTFQNIFICILVAAMGYFIYCISYVPPLPELESAWWGKGRPEFRNLSIKPFKIGYDSKMLQDLRNRLNAARTLTPPLERNQHYGFNSKLLNEILNFWHTKYNWEERVNFLNKFPQFTINVQGLKIHYLHIKPKKQRGVAVIPLLMLHGWPSSVREFYEAIPLLTTPKKDDDFVFEVIVPSLPGFIFSEGTSKPGLGAAQMAVVLKNLMVELGFDKFYVHGGDIGSVIAQNMATLYSNHVAGFHSNLCLVYTPLANLKLLLGWLYPSLVVEKKYEDKVYPLSETFIKTYLLEKGYTHIQATKPDTLGVALNDSPAGLAAYILEKFITWTNAKYKDLEKGGLDEKFSYTDLIDNIMLYWTTNSMTTAMRFYAETLNKKAWTLGIDENPIMVPSACSRYVNDYYYYPDSILRLKFHKLVYTSDHDNIGHFAALEAPVIFADDLYQAMRNILAAKITER